MGGNLYRAPYYHRNLSIGPRIDSNLGQSSPKERPGIQQRDHDQGPGLGLSPEILGNSWGYVGIMEKKMETTM